MTASLALLRTAPSSRPDKIGDVETALRSSSLGVLPNSTTKTKASNRSRRLHVDNGKNRRQVDENIVVIILGRLQHLLHGWRCQDLTVFSDFYGKFEGRDYFTVEANSDHVSSSVDAVEHDFRRHVSENGLFVGDLKLEGSHIVSNAYPVYTGKADERAADIIAELRTQGIESIGRRGAFDYQPTARVTTLKAEIALNRRFGA
jgi:hypothetical protein